MKKTTTLLFAFLLLGHIEAAAHFGMLIPDAPRITGENPATTLTLSFSHPFEQVGMDLSRPEKFTVTANGKTTNLLETLQPATILAHQGWQSSYTFNRPGVYHFVMEPAPYWEAAEDLSIIHYTKTIIPAFADDVGWDQPLGLPTEIVPLLRPFGNYAGNSFTGQVFLHGKPVAGAEVEVEFYHPGQHLEAPSDHHITQLIKADGQGIFTFTCPLPGWWGFAALNEADYTIKNPAGEEKGVEIGAVLWLYFDETPKIGR